MSDFDLLPPNQRELAVYALLGNLPCQRAVLERAVRLAEAGIEPIDVFKRAVMVSLKNALDKGRLPASRSRGGTSKGADGVAFKAAVAYWKEFHLNGKSGANKRATIDCEFNNPKYVSVAVKNFGEIAEVAALRELAHGDESGPDLKWTPKLEALQRAREARLIEFLGFVP